MLWRSLFVTLLSLPVVVWPQENISKTKETVIKQETAAKSQEATPTAKPCSLCSYQGKIPSHEWLAFEAIYNLHKQIDDDANGNIDLEESIEFLNEELKGVENHERKLERFHGKKNMISVTDFWNLWISSEVHNWTVEEVADWIEYHVHLRQYRNDFISNNINGTMIPRLANSKEPSLLQQLGIVDPIHRQKVAIKVMEVVLFGPPRDYLNGKNLKWIFTLVVVLFVTLAVFSYRQIRISKVKLEQVMKDLDRLTNAEQAFIRLQEEHEALYNKSAYTEDGVARSASIENASGMEEEIQRLRKENELLCTRLKETEGKTSWKTPIDLAHWLQLTYEIETVAFNKKRQQADLQLAAARRACDQLKKKRSNLISAITSTHGNGLEDVDGIITQARNALMEVTRDLRERTCRWRSIERICGISIIENPGLNYLRFVLKNDTRLLQSSDSGSELNATFPDHDGPLLGQIHDITSTKTEPTFSSPVREQSVVLDSPSMREVILRQDSDLLVGVDGLDGTRQRSASASTPKFFVGDQETEEKRSLTSAVNRVDSASRLTSRMNGIPEKPDKNESSGDNESGRLSIPSHNSSISLVSSGDMKSRKNPKFKRFFSSFTKPKKKKDIVPAP